MNNDNIGLHSIVAEDVEIGEGSRIWHHCNLYGCKIGENTQIGSYTEIKQGAEIGDNCRFQSKIFVPEGTKIGDYVFIGPGVVFLNDKYPSAIGAMEDNWELEPVIVEDEVSIGGGVVILPGVKLGYKSLIGAGSVVTKDVPSYGVVQGNPARCSGDTRDEKYSKFMEKLRGGRE